MTGFFGNPSRKRQFSQPLGPVIENRTQNKQTSQERETAHLENEPQTKKAKRNATEECMPLAERMRPKSLEELVGHEDLVGPNGVLRELILTDRIPSMILWSGPGVQIPDLSQIITRSFRWVKRP